MADSDEAYREYGIKFESMENIKDADAVVLAVAHDEFKDIKQAELNKLYKDTENSKKVLIDIKGLLSRKEYENNGYNYWRL